MSDLAVSHGFVAPTDHDWYRFLFARPELSEVNFWRPGPQKFAAVRRGEPFFFKLKAPYNKIGGFGLVSGFVPLPLWEAWDVFGKANGAANEFDLLRSIDVLGPTAALGHGLNRVIGCVAVNEPVFFEPDEWVAPPADWSPSIMRGKRYDLASGEGERIWRECLERAAARAAGAPGWATEAIGEQLVGKPVLITPRLGQSTFRLAVLDAYHGQCAVTTEHSLPVLEAAHIRPWAKGGRHEIRNGIPLRRDIHRLFDLGYVTVRPDLHFAVSPKLHQEFENGHVYYELDGREIRVPAGATEQPSAELLSWHGDVVFQAH